MVQSIRPILRKTRSCCIFMAQAKELDELRCIDRAFADGGARIKKQREIIADLGLLGADPTQAKAVLDAYAIRPGPTRTLSRDAACPIERRVGKSRINPVRGQPRRHQEAQGSFQTHGAGAKMRLPCGRSTIFVAPTRRACTSCGSHLSPGLGPIAAHWCFGSSARVGHNARMTNAPNCKLALTRVIEPTSGPGVEVATLEDAARLSVCWGAGRSKRLRGAQVLNRAARPRCCGGVKMASSQTARASCASAGPSIGQTG